MCMFYKFDALKFIYRNEIDIGTLFKFLLTVYGLSVYIWSKLSSVKFNPMIIHILQLKACDIKTILTMLICLYLDVTSCNEGKYQ